ncbi:MAG: DUF177 domain-containing protein [Candidatus Omnitrophica bacterium]|nr:DUF177 domain-containing protein [Candidatus Omnitrophota bacterium]
MKIDVKQIPTQGLVLEEEIACSELDLDTDIIKFQEPVKIKAQVIKITNVVRVDLSIETRSFTNCSRCLEEYSSQINKQLKLNYHVDEATQTVDLNPDIREELMLDYPIKPLCKPDCKGLCPKCGENLNQRKCKCQLKTE